MQRYRLLEPPGFSRGEVQGIALSRDRLAVADTANNRVLLFTELPRKGAYHPADCVIGQTDFEGAGENRWQTVACGTLCWPYGIWFHKNRLAIADSGNNRVMIWRLDLHKQNRA